MSRLDAFVGPAFLSVLLRLIFPALVKRIDHHKDMVKGLAFDPVGEFLSTQVTPGPRLASLD